MDKVATTALVLALVACGTSEIGAPPDVDAGPASDTSADTEVDGPTDSGVDAAEDGSVDGSEDIESDTPDDSVEDVPGGDARDAPIDVALDPATCIEGESRTEGCMSCICFDGEWSCTTDEWCAIEECLEECGVGCPAPEFQPCGDDLRLWCSPCHMDCHGVTEVERALCDDPLSTCGPPPPDAEPFVEHRLWEPPPDCVPPEWGEWRDDRFFVGEDDLAAEYGCESGSGVDWATLRIARATYPERIEVALTGVWTREDQLLVGLGARVYCGGAAPPSTSVHLLVPREGPTSLGTMLCSYGRCTGPPVP